MDLLDAINEIQYRRSIVRLYGNCDVSLAALLVTTTENGHVVTDCDLASRNCTCTLRVQK
jgi:hypothetical protein